MEPQGLPQDRVAKVKPFWASVSQDDRLKLLSIPLSELKQRAAEVGARQRKELGGQAASQYHYLCLLGGGSLDKPKQRAPGGRARGPGWLLKWHAVRARCKQQLASDCGLSSTGHLQA